MRKNTHRKTIEVYGKHFANRNFEKDFVANDIAQYNYSREDDFPQQLEAYCLNDLTRGKREQDRCGNTVFAKELRLKLILRSYLAGLDLATGYQDLVGSLDGTEEPSRNVRNYIMRVNEAAVQLGSHSFSGEISGVSEVATADAILANITAQSITANNDAGVIKIDDTHPHTGPIQKLTATSNVHSLRPIQTTYQQNRSHQVRILIVKYIDILMDHDLSDPDVMAYFLPLPDQLMDYYGPEGVPVFNLFNQQYGQYEEIKREVGISKYDAVPLVAPILEKVYKQVDILYEKIVTFSPQNPIFYIDDVWKLNETVVWQDQYHFPIDNGVFLFIYDLPTSYRQSQVASGGIGWQLSGNLMAMDLCSEFYYTQPE